jgi:hypothetical protein
LSESLDFQRESKLPLQKRCRGRVQGVHDEPHEKAVRLQTDGSLRGHETLAASRAADGEIPPPGPGQAPAGQFLRPLTAPVTEGPRLSRAWLCSSLPWGVDAADDALALLHATQLDMVHMVRYTHSADQTGISGSLGSRRTSTVPAPAV